MSTHIAGSNMSSCLKSDPKLIGHPNEADIIVNGIHSHALLDTGSCVSVVSKSFVDKHLLEIAIEDIGQMLSIECADGNQLPYIGYIEADLEIPLGIPGSDLKRSLLLVIPDTPYSEKTPIILGTNVLKEFLDDCKATFGDNFLQKAGLHTSWYLCFRTIVIRDRELNKNKNVIGIIRCAESERIILRPNQVVTIKGQTDKESNYPSTTAILQESKDSGIPDFIDVTPAVIQFENGKKKYVEVTLSNLTTNTVTISPRAVICEIQPVSVTEEVFDKIADPDKRPELLNTLVMDKNDILTEEEKAKLKNLLHKHIDIFSKHEEDIGHCDFIKHRIDLLPDKTTPFKQNHRRIPPMMIEEVRQHLEQLLSAGIIKKSKSPWASNIVLVRKKNGSLRMCVDYRCLNSRTVKDAYALPRIEEMFDVLKGSKYFSTIDMKSGYHQVEIEEEHKDRTAFTVGPLGFFEYNRMPFGLSNSPATYQRLMEECLGDYNMTICVIYLDDLIVFGDTFEEHLYRLDLVLTRIAQCNLKLSPQKCIFIQEKVGFLGHIVSAEGIETDPAKIEKIKNWPAPTNADELRSFLAFAGYYRRFVKNFSKITRELSDLLPPTSKKKGRYKVVNFLWTEKEQKIFEDLKDILSSPPVLAYPDFSLPFELHTDASSKGLGAVLYQEQNGAKRVIAYASRSLSKSEKNYSAFKLEFLALKWAITEKFSDYLTLNHFTVLTDNNPLTYVLTSAKLDATGHRWASALGEYSFDIFYRPGLTNTDADIMSRYPFYKSEAKLEELDKDTIKAVCNSIVSCPYIETLPACGIDLVEATEIPGQSLALKALREVRKMQRQDPMIEKWRKAVIDNTAPKNVWNNEDLSMKKQFKNFRMKRGLLFRVVSEEDREIEQLVIPVDQRDDILKGLHNDVGHPGKERTLRLLRDRFYWPGMTTSVDKWVTKCERCLRRKSSTNERAPLVNVSTTYPLELVCFDYLTLEPSKGGISNILVITDHFTKYAMAVPTRNQTAKTTAEAFFNNFVVNLGIPTRLHSDQGANFESDIIKELCLLMNTKKTHTTPYHPQGNAGPERFNRTLLDMLGTLETSKKEDWKKYVNALVYFYNSTPHESIRLSPFEVMFGRKPKLPIDLEYAAITDETASHTTKEYIQELRDRLDITRKIVEKYINKSKDKQKKQYDRRSTPVKLSIGDRVLVKIMSFEGKHKIADKFEKETYLIIDQPRPEIPVFKLKSDESGIEKTLHRNLLVKIQGEEVTEDVDVAEREESDETTVELDETDKMLEVTKMHDVMPGDESDNEDGDSVYETHFYGDAHKSTVGAQPEKTDESKEHQKDDLEVGDVTIDENLNGEDSEIQVDEEHPHRKETENDIQGTSNGQDKTENKDIEDSEEKDVTIQHRNIDLPVPAPRRSSRQRKPPDRYGEYVSKVMSPRPFDNRLHALDELMKSGVINNMDSEIVHKLIAAIMN